MLISACINYFGVLNLFCKPRFFFIKSISITIVLAKYTQELAYMLVQTVLPETLTGKTQRPIGLIV